MRRTTDPRYLTPAETARLLLVSPITLRALAQKGDLPSESTPGGHRRYRREEVERFLRERGRSSAGVALRVLIVDDDIQVTAYLTELLDTLPGSFHCETAHDGCEAGRKAQTFAPDVVLLDLMMPGMNGIEVCRRLKTDPATAAVRVIAMTGFPSKDNVKAVLAVGAAACLGKPIDETALLTALADLLHPAST